MTDSLVEMAKDSKLIGGYVSYPALTSRQYEQMNTCLSSYAGISQSSPLLKASIKVCM